MRIVAIFFSFLRDFLREWWYNICVKRKLKFCWRTCSRHLAPHTTVTRELRAGAVTANATTEQEPEEAACSLLLVRIVAFDARHHADSLVRRQADDMRQTCYNRSKVTYKLSTTTKGGSKGPLFSFAYILPTLFLFLSIRLYFYQFQVNQANLQAVSIFLFLPIYTHS